MISDKQIGFYYLGSTLAIDVFKFDWHALGIRELLAGYRPNQVNLLDRQTNSTKYTDWVVDRMEAISSDKVIRSIGIDNRFNAQAVFMNTNNRTKLHANLISADYIQFGPNLCDVLADDEYGIEISHMLRRIRDGEVR